MSRGRTRVDWSWRLSVCTMAYAAFACRGSHHVFSVEPKLAVQTSQHIAAPMDPSRQDVLVISDTHASFPFSPHATASDGVGFGDTYVTHVAVRPPQMDMWGPTVLRWLLRRHQDVGLVVHLGDAANASCQSEMNRFVTVMGERTQPWVMAPGNHDSLMMGNFGEHTSFGRSWDMACSPDRIDRMNKNVFITAYAAAQGWALRARSDAQTCHDIADLKPPFERVHVCIDPRNAHRSYILQQVTLGQASLFVVDATAYSVAPDIIAPGGKVGEIGEAQMAVLRTWMTEAMRHGSTAFVIASHFPLDFIDPDSSDGLRRLIESFPVVAYWSAHTHDTTTALYHPRSTRDHEFLEINFGSILDWPMEYARVKLSSQAECPRCWQLELTAEDLAAEMACNSALKNTCRASRAHYTMYKPGWIRSYLLWWMRNPAYDLVRFYMYEKLKTDLGITLSSGDIEREATERRTELRPELEEYERCQARWASEAESTTREGVAGHRTHWDLPTRPVELRAKEAPSSHWLWKWRP